MRLAIQLCSGLALASAFLPVHATAFAEFAVCSPRYRVVLTGESTAEVAQVAAELRSRIGPLCRSFGEPFLPDSVQRLLNESLSANHQALVAERRLSIYVEEGR